MRRVLAVLVGAVSLALGAGPASADVHGVSQAECSAPIADSRSGAQVSREAPGRPDAPIPVTASDERTQGRGDLADAQGTNC